MVGDFVFEVDGKTTQLPAGGAILAPRGLAHRWANSGATEGSLIVMFQPGGFEAFFNELFEFVAKHPHSNLMDLRDLYAKYQMDLLGPAIYSTVGLTPPKG